MTRLLASVVFDSFDDLLDAIQQLEPSAHIRRRRMYIDECDTPFGFIVQVGPACEFKPLSTPVAQETEPVSTVAAIATKVGEAIGLIDNEQTRKFRKCQQVIATKTAIDKEAKKLRSQIAAAREAQSKGEELKVKIDQLEREHIELGKKLFRVSQAESEAVGLCPSQELQSERRRIREELKKSGLEVNRLKNELDRQAQMKMQLVEQSQSPARDPISTEHDQQQIPAVDRLLVQLQDDLQAAIEQRERVEKRREQLYARMRAVEV